MRLGGRYLVIAGFVAVACIGAAAVVNLVVDPYGFYRWVDVAGFNRIKPRAGQQVMRNKVHGIVAHRPDVVVLGNSRAEIGFDPASRAWPARANVYNAGVPGAGMDNVAALLQLAVSQGQVKVTLIGLDFVDFLTVDDDASPRQPPAEAPRATALDARARVRDAVTGVLSFDALADSLVTLASQRDRHAPTVTGRGFNPMHDYEAIAATEGYRALFAQRNLENARSYLRDGLHLEPSSPPGPSWTALARMKATCIARSIHCVFVIYPYHADILELFDAAGLWPSFERWKREAAAMLVVPASVGATPIELWDFSGYDAYTTEAVLASGKEVDAMRWYWEAGHFKAALGERIVRRAFDGDAEPFGNRMVTGEVDADLAAIRAARDRYRVAQPRAAQAIRELVQRLRGH
jgi:hypothetical protein